MTAKDDNKTNGVDEARIAQASISAKRQEQKQEAEELLQHAKDKQKQKLDALKKAPADASMFMERNEREELARQYVPEAFIHERPENWRKPGTKGEYKKGSTKVAVWTAGSPEWKRKQSNAGYLPVLDKGIQVSSSGGDVLWEGPIEFEKAKVERSNRLHVQRIRDENRKYESEMVAGGGRVGKDDSLTFEQGG